MTVSPNTQAILLLTVHFSKGRDADSKPLTPKEYGRFAEWLKQQSLRPEQLLGGDLREQLHGWQDRTISVERVQGLLGRGSALALSMEKWLRVGLWVMTRSDSDYPQRLKRRLRGDSPAVLFGCGNRALLGGGGIAVVGSRHVQQADLDYSRQLGERAAAAGLSIVSGGAKGVDQAAMLGALDASGTAVGVLADRLLSACSSARYREHLVDGNLVLLTPFNPEAGFNAGNAMQRNKYVYCLADAGLVVHSGTKGGTWTGARENLKRQWVPLWVKPSDDPQSGNAELIREGAAPLPSALAELELSSLREAAGSSEPPATDLFDGILASREAAISPAANGGSAPEASAENAPVVKTPSLANIGFYELFLAKAHALCAENAMSKQELLEALDLKQSQIEAWLKRAVDEGWLEKLSRPIRYRVACQRQDKLSLD